MLDIKLIRENPEGVNAALRRRNPELSIDALLEIDKERREILLSEESCRNRRNQLTEQIAKAKKAGEDTATLQEETRGIAQQIKALEQKKEELADRQQRLILDIPNMPHPEAPTGVDERDNRIVKTWGEEYKSRTAQDVLPHYEIGTQLGILDFERGVKVAQSRFSVLRGEASRLERALINFMLDLHTSHGYEEILPPFLVNPDAMRGTGQLPKFEADMFKCRDDDLFLIPTAEVPLTNLYRDEVLETEQLPVSMTAYTPCFRREAGSAGKDTRGLIRQHQFDKVELVKIVSPETSEAEHLKLTADAERVLQLLELPYRLVELCTGDLGFGAARCYDLEVWMPAQGVYREISSCSNFMDFQARRANIKYRSPETGRLAYAHTLNGSALAVGRTLAAILENYQVLDQKINKLEVVIPDALRPYLRNQCTRL